MAKTSKSKIKVFGADELKRAMDLFGNEMKQAVDEAIKDTAESIKDNAQSRAPVKTGALKRGIIVKKFRARKDTLAVYDIGMDPSMNEIFRGTIKNPKGKRKDYYYPTVIEYGTPHTPAQPFLRPALKGHRTRAKKAVIERVRMVINRDY